VNINLEGQSLQEDIMFMTSSTLNLSWECGMQFADKNNLDVGTKIGRGI